MRLKLFIAAIGVTVLTELFSILSANQTSWIVQTTPSTSPLKLSTTYGLFSKCDQSVLDKSAWLCRDFPKQDTDCRVSPSPFPESFAALDLMEDEPATHEGFIWDMNRNRAPMSAAIGDAKERRYSSFCSYWRLAGYASQMSIAFGAAALVALLVIVAGGKNKRRAGWPICAGLVGLHAILQLATWVIVLVEFQKQERFYLGARLGQSFALSTASIVLDILLALVFIGTGLAGAFEIPDKGYRPIPDL